MNEGIKPSGQVVLKYRKALGLQPGDSIPAHVWAMHEKAWELVCRSAGRTTIAPPSEEFVAMICLLAENMRPKTQAEAGTAARLDGIKPIEPIKRKGGRPTNEERARRMAEREKIEDDTLAITR